jgi:hypothetical protein
MSKIQAIAATVCLLATATDIRAQVYCHAPSVSTPPMLSLAYRPREPGRPFCLPHCSPERVAEYERELSAYQREIAAHAHRLEQQARDLEAYHAAFVRAHTDYERCLQQQRDAIRR